MAALSLYADIQLPEKCGRIMMTAVLFTTYIGIRTPKTLARRVWAARIFVKSGLTDLLFILFFLLSAALAALADMDALIAFVNIIYIPPLIGSIFYIPEVFVSLVTMCTINHFRGGLFHLYSIFYIFIG